MPPNKKNCFSIQFFSRKLLHIFIITFVINDINSSYKTVKNVIFEFRLLLFSNHFKLCGIIMCALNYLNIYIYDNVVVQKTDLFV